MNRIFCDPDQQQKKPVPVGSLPEQLELVLKWRVIMVIFQYLFGILYCICYENFINSLSAKHIMKDKTIKYKMQLEMVVQWLKCFLG